MNKKLAIILIVVAFLGGVLTSGYFGKRFINTFYSTSLAAQAGMDVTLLTWLRANNVTNAITLLEIELDGSLVGLGVYLQDIPASSRDSTQVKILQKAKVYRDKFPYKSSSPLGDQMVSNAFLLVDVKTNE